MNNRGRSDKSLCEKSMVVVTNIVKLSALSIAKISLGTYGPPPPTNNLAYVAGTATVVKNPPLPKFPAGLRSQEPQSSSKPISYLTEPGKGNGSLGVIREEKSVDKNPPLPKFSTSLRSQEPQSSSKPRSYPTEPGKGNVSLGVIREEKSIDGKASDFIKKVHEKNQYDLDETSNLSASPPRRVVM